MATRKQGRVKGRLIEVEGDARSVARTVDKLIGSGAIRVDEPPPVWAAPENVNAEAPPEQVVHPSHYGGAADPYEAIKVIEAWDAGFNVGSALKYIRRAGRKVGQTKVVDLEKARFYIDREIQLDLGRRPAEVVRSQEADITDLRARLARVEAQRLATELDRQELAQKVAGMVGYLHNTKAELARVRKKKRSAR
jgi:hypothetical protein